MSDRRLPRPLIALGIGLIVAACIVAGVFGARVLGPADSKEDVTDTVVRALIENCEINLQYRKQTRERAIINQKAQGLQVEANEALINVVNEIQLRGYTSPPIVKLGRVLDRVNAQINTLRASSTALLPLPDCTQYRTILRDSAT